MGERDSEPSIAPADRTVQYLARDFTESAGAVVFDLTYQKIWLINPLGTDLWILPRGRVNSGEPRRQAAIRACWEELGLRVKLLPIKLESRSPPALEVESDYPDEVREHNGVADPFMLTLCFINHGARNRTTYWYIVYKEQLSRRSADVRRGARFDLDPEALDTLRRHGTTRSRIDAASAASHERQFDCEMFDFRAAYDALSYVHDKRVVKEATDLYCDSLTADGVVENVYLQREREEVHRSAFRSGTGL